MLTGLGLVNACGFRPVYAPATAEGELSAVDAALGQIEMARDPVDRIEFMVHDALKRDLRAVGGEGLAIYVLALRVRSDTTRLAIQLDNEATRFNFTLTAAFQLRDRASQALLYDNFVRRTASYNALDDPFATQIARRDAERRVAIEIAHEIRTLLSVALIDGLPQPAA